MVARLLLHRDAFAGNGCFIHAGVAFDHYAVYRHQTSGLYQENVTFLQALRGHFLLLSVPGHKDRHFGSQIHQLGDGFTGLALGTTLQIFSDGNQGQDRTGGFKIQVVGIVLYHRHVAVAQSIADPVHGENAIHQCRAGAQCDQAVHVGTAVRQCLESY